MPDKFSKETRSRIMSHIRSKNTKVELAFRKELVRKGLRGYRIHKKIIGNPDIVFTKKKIAVFIDGDFWHGYNWKIKGKTPPKEYWQEKIQKTIGRDKKINSMLKKDGWTVIRFWEHEIKSDIVACIQKVSSLLKK